MPVSDSDDPVPIPGEHGLNSAERDHVPEPAQAAFAFGEALMQCLPIVALMALAPLILAQSGQGHDALLVATDGTGFAAFALTFLGALLVYAYATLVLDTVPSAWSTQAAEYARIAVPQLIGLTLAFSLPLLVHYVPALHPEYTITPGAPGLRVSVGFALQAMQVAGPAAVVVAAAFLGREMDGTPPPVERVAAVAAAATACGVLFVVTDEQSVLTRYLGDVVSFLVANGFASAHARRRGAARAPAPVQLSVVSAVYAVLVVSAALYVAAAPAERAPALGPAIVLLLSALTWVAAAFLLEYACWVVIRARSSAARPVRRRALAGSLIAARIGILVLVGCRLLSGAFGDAVVDPTPTSAAPRDTLVAYVDRWLTQRRSPTDVTHPYPVFIVTAEGGGMRAAYWTANVLTALQEQFPTFASHTLALSGVSGGSVGASVFAALTTPSAGAARRIGDDSISRTVAPLRCRGAGALLRCAQAIGRGDLLSAPLASLLLAEPMHRLFGFPPGADRAVALERALERAYSDATGDARFAAPFAAVAATGGALLLPNATQMGTGERLVVVPLAPGMAFSDARTLDGRPFSLGRAALLSARFPIISPAAVYADPSGARLRITDGGYADNSGAATAADILTVLDSALRRPEFRGRFQPVVLALTNGADPAAAESRDPSSVSLFGALADPVATFDAVRAANSVRFARALCTRVITARGLYLDGFHLRHGSAELPLGWMLAGRTADTIDARLRALRADPTGDVHRIGVLLHGAGYDSTVGCGRFVSKDRIGS